MFGSRKPALAISRRMLLKRHKIRKANSGRRERSTRGGWEYERRKINPDIFRPLQKGEMRSGTARAIFVNKGVASRKSAMKEQIETAKRLNRISKKK